MKYKLPPANFESLPRSANGIVDVDPDWINVDAQSFQFKAGGDKDGITDRLAGVNKFDPQLCGLILLWQDKKGRLFLADGHQRMGLAQRARERGQNGDVMLPARVYKEADGISKEEMKIVAAFKNIAEGTGTTLDVARVIRQHGTLPETIPPRSHLVQNAKMLATLGEETFSAVYNNTISPERGAVIGKVLFKSDPTPDKRQMYERAMLKAFVEFKPATDLEAEFLAKEVMRTGTVGMDASQPLLFDFKDSDNILKERAEILATARRYLSESQGDLNFIQHKPHVIEPFIEDGKKINRKDVKNKYYDTVVERVILDQGWQYKEVGSILNAVSSKYGRMKQKDNDNAELSQLMILLDQSLTISARDLKLAKIEGDKDDQIIKLRANYAKDFLGKFRDYLATSDMARTLRRSLGHEAQEGEERARGVK